MVDIDVVVVVVVCCDEEGEEKGMKKDGLDFCMYRQDGLSMDHQG